MITRDLRVWCVAGALCVFGGCRERPPARVRLGADERVRMEYVREAAPWRTPDRPALDAESAAARVAIEEAGMLDPARADLQRCGARLGFRSGDLLYGLDGLPHRPAPSQCGSTLSAHEFAQEIRRSGAISRDAVTRAILLRLGGFDDELAAEPQVPRDRWSTLEQWAMRLWEHGVRNFAGVGDEPIGARQGVAYRALLHARNGVAAFERSGASDPSVMQRFAFAALAKELDESRWVESSLGSGPRMEREGRAFAWPPTFPALVLDGWEGRAGDGALAVSGPERCSPQARAVRALRYRPSAEWFNGENTDEILGDWRALEGLLRALLGRSSLVRTMIVPCDEREVLRPARAHEVAYVMLAAMLGFDALAPAEHDRFAAGDPRLRFELESRFRERIQRMNRTAESLARVVLDQQATRRGWPRAARALREAHQRESTEPGPTLALQRNRDAARLIAAARSSDDDPDAQCALLSAALAADLPFARENAAPIALSTLRAPVASSDRTDVMIERVRCRLAVLDAFATASTAEFAALLEPLLTRERATVERLTARESLATLERAPNAISTWRPTLERGYEDFTPGWLSPSALRLYARNPGLRRWATELLQSEQPYNNGGREWRHPTCASSAPSTQGQRALCAIADALTIESNADRQTAPSLAEVRTRAMLWLTPPPR